MDRPAENPADAGSASPATPTANRVSVNALEMPADAAEAGSLPFSASRALRAVAKRFVSAYYDDLNASPSRVARYYIEDSVFTVEDASTPTTRTRGGRTGKQSEDHPENQQRKSDARESGSDLDFYDSGPDSPMRRLMATAPSTSGTDGIIARRERLFANRHARIVSTDVQHIPGAGNALAVVLGTLSRRDARETRGSSSGASRERRGKEVTFMHSFVLARRGHDGAKAAFADEEGIDLDDLVIVNEVFRRVDPVDADSPAATAATVLAAAMSPPPTPPRATTPQEDRDGCERLDGGIAGVDGRDVSARLAAATPRKNSAASPNPFVDEREDLSPGALSTPTASASRGEPTFASAASRFGPSVAGASRPTSPDARAIPLPSPGLLSRPGSSERAPLRRRPISGASRHDASAETDDDGLGRVSRTLAFEQERVRAGTTQSREASNRLLDRSPREESSARSDAPRREGRDALGAFGGPPSARVTREHRERRRVYSSASSSPAMSAGDPRSTRHSPYHDRNGIRGKDSPAAKRGLGFLPAGSGGFLPADPRDWGDPRDSPGGAPPGARLVTLSERSDEGSQGAHSMSVSVSSQPSVSGRDSEDGDGESHPGRLRDDRRHAERPRDDDSSLREFPVDELEPVNLEDVRTHRLRYQNQGNLGAVSGPSSRRSSPAATPSRRRASAGRDPRSFPSSDRRLAAANARWYPYDDANLAYDARGYATRAYHSARASPVVSREGGRRGEYRRGEYAMPPRGGSRSAATSAAASPAPSRGGSRGGFANTPRGARDRARGAEYGFSNPRSAAGYARRFESAPPSPSMGATRAEAFGARTRSARVPGYPREFRFETPRGSRGESRASGSRASSYRVVGVGVHGETIVASKPEPEEQLDVAVNYLAMLAAALHFTAAAVAFAVLVVAVAANKTSSRRLAARLDRVDTALAEWRGGVAARFSAAKADTLASSSFRAAGVRAGDAGGAMKTAGEPLAAKATQWGTTQSTTYQRYALPSVNGAGPAAPPTPRAPTDA